jgi:hypothetical protein
MHLGVRDAFGLTGSEVKLTYKTLQLYFVPTCSVFLTTWSTVLFYALRLSACNEIFLHHGSHLKSVRHFFYIYSTTVVNRVDCNNVTRKVTVEWVEFILHTLEVSGSNRNLEKWYVAWRHSVLRIQAMLPGDKLCCVETVNCIYRLCCLETSCVAWRHSVLHIQWYLG